MATLFNSNTTKREKYLKIVEDDVGDSIDASDDEEHN